MHNFQGQWATVFGLQQKYIFSLIYNKICLTNNRKKKVPRVPYNGKRVSRPPSCPLAPDPTAFTDTSKKFSSH